MTKNAAARENRSNARKQEGAYVMPASAASHIYVQPTLQSHMSLSVESAKRIYPSDKANHFYDEAKKVVERGEQFRIWS